MSTLSASPTTSVFLPPVVSRAEWQEARRQLLADEKAHTRAGDALAARRRRLPMVQVEKQYTFTGPEGPRTFAQLFEGRRQLYVHHFMWNAERQTHCPGCTMAAELGFENPQQRAFLAERDVTFVAVSRAPWPAIQTWQAQHGWTFPWYSSAGSTFNTDFHATLDEAVTPVEVNYRSKAEWLAQGLPAENLHGDWPVNSVFLRDGEAIFHTYSAFNRGLDRLFLPNNFLDLTPYGRQEDWEDSPAGWPQRPTYG